MLASRLLALFGCYIRGILCTALCANALGKAMLSSRLLALFGCYIRGILCTAHALAINVSVVKLCNGMRASRKLIAALGAKTTSS